MISHKEKLKLLVILSISTFTYISMMHSTVYIDRKFQIDKGDKLT